MRRELDLFRGLFEDMWGQDLLEGRVPSLSPSCDVEETKDHYVVSMDMPGVSKNDIKIEVKGDQLTVSGERKLERTEDKRTRHLTERSYGRFQRTFALPSQVDTNKIEAVCRDGVLQIAIPKSEALKPRQINIGESETGGFFGKKSDAEKPVKEIHAA